MADKYFILRQVADFAPGFFENTAVDEGAIQLSRQGQGFVGSGSYTSIPFSAGDFFNLIPSWNADTPPNTSVEMQARVASDGRWSRWLSFGQWGLYGRRATQVQKDDEVARCNGESITLVEGRPAAGLAQLRILLSTEDTAKTPRISLLGLCTNGVQKSGQDPPAFNRELALPAYSCQNRDPAIAANIASATTLCMLMNRYGRDLLPEEVARAAYDSGAGQYGNLPFLCAVAGAQGFYSHLAYTGLGLLRHQVWQGRAVGARVHYRAPALSGQEDEADKHRPLPPVLDTAKAASTGHLVAVHGFVQRGGIEHVVLSDPLAPTDEAVRQEMPLATFSKIYTGLALFMEKGPSGAGQNRLQRHPATLALRDNLLRLYAGEEELVPAKLLDHSLTPSTICYTLSDGIAYASAAQRKFYYPVPDEHGSVRFERTLAAGRRLVFYLVGPAGNTWVAEKQLDQPGE